jgi:hypothetical protein
LPLLLKKDRFLVDNPNIKLSSINISFILDIIIIN